MEKFELGEIVYERVRPNQNLIITQQIGKIYYCVPQENIKRKAFTFNARDLKGISPWKGRENGPHQLPSK